MTLVLQLLLNGSVGHLVYLIEPAQGIQICSCYMSFVL